MATIASVSKAIGKRSQTQYLWEELYRNDFGSFEHSFRSHNSLSHHTRYKRAFDSFKLRHCQFYHVCHGRESGGAIERQGSNGTMITTIPKAVFCILGGWTTRGMSVALSVLYERPARLLPLKTGYDWKTYAIRNRNRENATYGHSVTRIPPGAIIESEALLTYGGVTMGGYRGEVSCLTAIIIDVESEESKSMNEPGIFWWKPLTLDNRENGAIAIEGDNVFECGIQKNLSVVDLTGAGDLFAAGFLHGHVNNFSIRDCLIKGTEMSSKIIQQIGARL